MLLFPVAFVWVGFVLYWVIVKNAVGPQAPPEEPRRWPRRPDDPEDPLDGSRLDRDGRAGRRPARLRASMRARSHR